MVSATDPSPIFERHKLNASIDDASLMATSNLNDDATLAKSLQTLLLSKVAQVSVLLTSKALVNIPKSSHVAPIFTTTAELCRASEHPEPTI